MVPRPEPWRACRRARRHRAFRCRRPPAAPSPHPGAGRRGLPRCGWPVASGPRRARATGAGPACAFGIQVHAGSCSMSPAGAGETLGQLLERYLAEHWGNDVRVRDLSRIPGGASRETYRFDAEVGGEIRGMILRRDPVGGLIDTDRQTEFLAYQSFHDIVPVPEPLVLE